MKNISLIALVAALAITPNTSFAFSDAAIADQTAKIQRQKTVSTAVGHEATQADLNLAAKVEAAGEDINAANMATAAALQTAGLDVNAANGVAARALEAAGEDINAANMATAAALQTAGLAIDIPNLVSGTRLIAAALPVDAANVAAGVALSPMVAAGVALDAVKVNTLTGAANDNVYNAMAWAMNNGFAGQPVGTIPAGIARYDSRTGAGHPRFIMEFGVAPLGASADRFDGPANMRFKTESPDVAALGLAINDYIVFSGLTDTDDIYVRPDNAAKAL